MESSVLKCKQCGGPLDYKEGSNILRCPHCGFSERIDESDAVKVERIRAEAELGKRIIDNKRSIEEKRINLRKLRYVFAIVIFVLLLFVIGLVVYNKLHEGKVHIKEPNTYYVGKDYQMVHRLFEEAGFVFVEDIKQEVLSKEQESLAGSVSEVSIDGTAVFEKGWFSNKAPVTIYYLALDPARANDIQIPMTSTEVAGLKYQEVIDSFCKAGFRNITLMPSYDIKLGLGKETVQAVTVGGHNVFGANEWVPNDTEITVSYRAKAIDYVDEDYRNIIKTFKDIGFFTVLEEPLGDLKINDLKKEGKVTSVLIDGAEFSEAKKLNLQSEIVVRYHSKVEVSENQVEMTVKAKEFDGMNYQEAADWLAEMGFINIKLDPLNDLSKDILKRDGKVTEVSINGNPSFAIGDVFYNDVEVIVTYHSKK